MKEELKRCIEEYINKCNHVIEENNNSKAESLQDDIIGVFSTIIPKIMESLDYWVVEGQHVNYLGNIKLLKQRLNMLLLTEGTYSLKPKESKAGSITLNANSSVSGSGNSTNTNTNTNTVNATFDIKTELEKARKEVEENEYLDDDAKQEINEQLDQIESVMGEDKSNNDKWKKLKSVVNWVSNKGYKIGQLVMPLITRALFPDVEQ